MKQSNYDEVNVVNLKWTIPSTRLDGSTYDDHSFTKIFQASTNSFAAAKFVDSSYGDSKRIAVSGNGTFYFWAVNVSSRKKESPPSNVVSVLIEPTVNQMLTVLTGAIRSDQLWVDLGSRIDLIDNNASGSVNNRISQGLLNVGMAGGLPSNAITALQSSDATQNTTITGLNTTVGNQSSSITSLQNTTASQATSISQLTSSVNGNTTTIQQQTTSINGLSAQYTVKIDNNGYVSGFGLASTQVNGTPYSRFYIRSDAFAIGGPDTSGSTDANVPFIVRTSTSVVNGLTIPAGVYMKSAFIETVTADRVDTRGLTIKDNYGNVVFSAGNGLNVGLITGLGSLATQNSVSTGQVSGLGSLATQNSVDIGWSSSNVRIGGTTVTAGQLVSSLSKINSGNISTFIDGAAIGNAYIGNAAVNTLKIEGETVMVPRYAEGLYYYSLSDSWTPALSPLTFSINGLNSGESCRIMVVAVIQAYPTDITQITLDTGIFVDGVLNSDVGTTLESKGLTVSCIGSFLKQNGTYVVDIRLRCAPESGGAASKGTCTVIPKFIVMAAKR